MRALIFNGQLVQVSPLEFPVAPALQWVDAPNDATTETHIFEGGTVKPKPPKTQAEIDAEESARALAELREIDMASIRAIREYVASKADAPQYLKDKEAAAIAARARVKV